MGLRNLRQDHFLPIFPAVDPFVAPELETVLHLDRFQMQPQGFHEAKILPRIADEAVRLGGRAR